MKPFASQTYYELLEISVSASAADIRSAWERLNRMYADDQLALYGLASAGTAAALRKRLHEAMEVLTDDELRGMYDEELGLPARDLTVEEPVTSQLEMGELLRGADHSLASTHPRVAFTWSEPTPSPGMLPPRASPPVAPPVPAPVVAAPVVAAPVAAPSVPVPVPQPLPSDAERTSEEAAISMLPRPSPGPRPSAPSPAPSAPSRMPDIPADAEFNGELLRKVRTSLGLSLAVVAERTRIGSKHLENVEADRYDALPATVYLRGILMSLAKELRLDGLKVSRSYLSLVERIRSKG